MNENCCAIKEPSILYRGINWLKWRWQEWRDRNKPSNLELHAVREFKAAGYAPLNEQQEEGPDKWIQENVLELLRVFAKQGHSGASAPFCIHIFAELARFKPLVPLQGTDDEWYEVGPGVWQNNRCSHVFKEGDGKAYDINGRIFREPNGACYTSKDSRVYISFPYTPVSEYVDVPGVTP